MKNLIFIILFLVGNASVCKAYQYKEIKGSNIDLKSTVVNQDRVLPNSKYFTMATDLNIWKYFPLVREDYYHGLGYWTDVFFEVRPQKRLTINAHLYAFNGTISKGFLDGGEFLQNFGASWNPFDSDYFKLRVVDLGRITLASGLIVEDREASGFTLKSKKGRFSTTLYGLGTSVISKEGDLIAIDLRYSNRYLALGGVYYYFNDLLRNDIRYMDSGELHYQTKVKRTLKSIYIKDIVEKGAIFDLELGLGDQKRVAGLIKLGAKNRKSCKFCYETYLQGRFYDTNIIRNLSGETNYDFIPYDFVERNYMNAQYLLSYNTRVQAYSAHFNFRYFFSSKYIFKSLNEFDYIVRNRENKSKKESVYWYKQSLAWCPQFGQREDCTALYLSNKVTNADSYRVINENTTPYIRRLIYGIEATIHF